jgi:hypothetical protein
MDDEKVINRESESQDKEINTMDGRNERKIRYVKIEDKWYDARNVKRRWDKTKYFTDKEAILLNIEGKTEEMLLK